MMDPRGCLQQCEKTYKKMSEIIKGEVRANTFKMDLRVTRDEMYLDKPSGVIESLAFS